MYRDPYVWRDGDRWRMLVGAALADGRAAALHYDAPDLENWTYRGPFHIGTPEPVGDTGHFTGEGWECPQYLPAADASSRGALIVSAWDHQDGPRTVLTLTGRDCDGTFEAAGPPQLLDHGPDFYAAALLRAPGGRWLLWGWAWEARAPEWSDTDGWTGTLTLPRDIEVTEDGRTYQQPAAELLALRGAHTIHAAGRMTGDEPVDLGDVGRSFGLTAHLTPSGEASLRLVTSTDGSEYLDIRLDPAAGRLVVDRDRASLDSRAAGGTYSMPCPSTEPVDLRLVVDHSTAELFLSTGQTLTLRFYPVGDGPWHLQARTARATRLDFTIDAWELLPLKIKEASADATT